MGGNREFKNKPHLKNITVSIEPRHYTMIKKLVMDGYCASFGEAVRYCLLHVLPQLVEEETIVADYVAGHKTLKVVGAAK